MRRTVVFSGSSHPWLVEQICKRLGLTPANVDLKKFSNGEISVEIRSSVRDQDVFIVQSGSAEINDNVMELLIMINACKGGSARTITAVMPYFPYSRQSKRKSHRGAIAARMFANLMKVAGVDHVITIDLHAHQMQGFFKCPVDNLAAQPILAKWIRLNIEDWEEVVVVSKNPGGTKRATSLADFLKLSFGIVTTERRRLPNMSASFFNGTILEGLRADGSVHPKGLRGFDDEEEAIEESAPKEHDFAPREPASRANGTDGTTHRRPSTPRAASARARLHLSNGHASPSPLSKSTRQESVTADDATPALHRIRTVPGIDPGHGEDSDGYEEAEGSDSDDQARDVITGRLISGHIVDDDAPSPSQSGGSEAGFDSFHTHRHMSEDDIQDPMTSSFMSVASSRMMQGHAQGLGGTGDATASDEEEEEALVDPKVESKVTLVGNVRGRPVVIVDDMIDKAGSWIAAAETVVKKGGATKVYCLATHGLFGGTALQELQDCEQIEKIVVTTAFPIPPEKRAGITKLDQLDISGLLAEAIRRNHHGESISQLYHHLYD